METEKLRAVRFGVSLKAKPIKYALSCRSSCSIQFPFPSPHELVWFVFQAIVLRSLTGSIKCPCQSYHLWGEPASCASDVTHGAWSQHVCLLCFSRVTFPRMMLLDLSSKKTLLIPFLCSPGSTGCVQSRHYPMTASSIVPKYCGQENIKTLCGTAIFKL